MLTKRIIPCLDVKDGRTVKGVNFKNLRDAGEAVDLAKFYSENGADELVFLDISATNEDRKTMVDFAAKVAREISIPFTIGGGISTVEDMEALFQVGADKVSVNSSAVRNPDLLSLAADKFGCQAVVLAVDSKQMTCNKLKITNKSQCPNANMQNSNDMSWHVFTHGGKKDTGLDVLEWIKKGQLLGAGEILLTSMDCDGVKDGFDIALLKALKDIVKVPLIASGGAGKKEHFLEIFKNDLADAGLAASIFHFGEIGIGELKEYLVESGVEMRL